MGRFRYCRSQLLSQAWTTYLRLPVTTWSLQRPPPNFPSAVYPVLSTGGKTWLEPEKTSRGKLNSFRGALVSPASRFSTYHDFEDALFIDTSN